MHRRYFSRKHSRKSLFEVLFAGGKVIEQRPQGREREKAQNGRFSAILRRASATQSGERLGICLSKKNNLFMLYQGPGGTRGTCTKEENGLWKAGPRGVTIHFHEHISLKSSLPGQLLKLCIFQVLSTGRREPYLWQVSGGQNYWKTESIPVEKASSCKV